MQQHIDWFKKVLNTSLALYFEQECEYISLEEVGMPNSSWLEESIGFESITFEERFIIMLTVMPWISPQSLDILLVQNSEIGRPFSEFGGWRGISHIGFLPTGETATFILARDNVTIRAEVIKLLDKNYRLYTYDILSLVGGGEGEPFLSGQLRPSDELLYRVIYKKRFEPEYNAGFPAKLVTTKLEWGDMILDYQCANSLEEIATWLEYHKIIMDDWSLNRFLKPGYRALFYGPSGTGKTLAAALIGKRYNMPVYRIDLSQIVSKYIGETEKNLSRIFDLAENRNWILFFDEADALFGKRTSTNTSNERYANQEVSYLLQKIEDFPGIVLLATNLRSNMDNAFYRRFQSVVYFPIPTEEMRMKLWEKVLPKNWLQGNAEKFIGIAAKTELSGGAIMNVVRSCALKIVRCKDHRLTLSILENAIQKEIIKF